VAGRPGFEPPRFNEPFGPFTLDAVWPTAGLIVEIDTYETHGTRHSFEADRRRDAYTASHGLRTIRVTPARWRDDGRRLARDLRRALFRMPDRCCAQRDICQLRRQLAADLGE
jgi:very-short-patch-repair endonuclease